MNPSQPAAPPDGERAILDALDSARPFEPEKPLKAKGSGSPAKDSAKTKNASPPPQRNLLLQIAENWADLWHAPDKTAFATIPIAATATVPAHVEHVDMRSRTFRLALTHRYYSRTRNAPSSQAMEEALKVLESRALFERPCHTPWLRTAEHEGRFYLDLTNESWQVVEISAEGWSVREARDVPVKFKRSRYALPLPAPIAGEPVDHLRGFVNASSDADFRLMVSWAVAALRPHGPYPIAILGGEQGTAKSVTTKVLRMLVDPNESLIRSEPREQRDLIVSAHANWVIAIDNMSAIPSALSDAFCRLSTGGGASYRALHSNDEELVFTATRPVLLNGIPDSLATRADLDSRCLSFNLPVIPKSARRPEREMWAEFESARPGILGALLDGVAASLRNLSTVGHLDLPRMADFAAAIVAASPGLGWDSREFLKDFAGNRSGSEAALLENDVFAQAICDWFRKARSSWTGAAKELLARLTEDADAATLKNPNWPRSATKAGKDLKRNCCDRAPASRSFSAAMWAMPVTPGRSHRPRAG